jgi:hypothetical protein
LRRRRAGDGGGDNQQTYKNGKPVCRYGAKCYRANPDHRLQFWHPPKNGGGGSSTTTPRKPTTATATTPARAAGDDDAISDEEDNAQQQREQNREVEGKVKTLSAMTAFRELDPGVIRDVLEANEGSLHLTMEALKQLV